MSSSMYTVMNTSNTKIYEETIDKVNVDPITSTNIIRDLEESFAI